MITNAFLTCVDTGLRVVDVKILVLLANSDRPLQTKEIERAIDLRQPEVSIAAKRLIRHGFITEGLNEHNGKKVDRQSYISLRARQKRSLRCFMRRLKRTMKKTKKESCIYAKRLRVVSYDEW